MGRGDLKPRFVVGCFSLRASRPLCQCGPTFSICFRSEPLTHTIPPVNLSDEYQRAFPGRRISFPRKQPINPSALCASPGFISRICNHAVAVRPSGPW
jgi:hypothetical protein